MTVTENEIQTSVTVSVPPASEPISLSEMKAHLRITDNDENAYISSVISAVSEESQAIVGRQWVTATRVWRLDDFPRFRRWPLEVPFAPLQSVSSITYIDVSGDEQTWDADDYDVDTSSEPGRIKPTFGETYPLTLLDTMGAVTVTFVCGYGSAADVPANKKAMLKLWAAHLFEQRDPVITGTIATTIPMGLQSLIESDRLNVPI